MAISTMTVGTKLEKNFRVDVACSTPFVIDQPKAGGGEGLGPNPLEVYLSSLGACICSIGKIIANQRRIKLSCIDVKVEALIDKDFLMGKTTEGRAGFTDIKAFIKIDADISKEAKENFIKDISFRCPIADNIANETGLSTVLVD